MAEDELTQKVVIAVAGMSSMTTQKTPASLVRAGG